MTPLDPQNVATPASRACPCVCACFCGPQEDRSLWRLDDEVTTWSDTSLSS